MYFRGSVQPSVQNLKKMNAAKRPKAVGLDGPEEPDQYFSLQVQLCARKSQEIA